MSDLVLGDIVAALGGELLGSAGLKISSISPLQEAGPESITFLSSARLRSQLSACAAACVITAPTLRDDAVARGAAIITPDPYLYFAKLTQWWAARMRPAVIPGIHPSAVIDASAAMGAGVHVGAGAVIEAGAQIGDGSLIGAQCYVGRNARVGSNSRLAPRVTIMFDCSLGDRCIVHSGVVIGADGFGFAPVAGQWEKIEQLGAVRIGNDVEIGANTCIDRGALGDTVLEDGVKLDNLIQIGHNVRIGAYTAMAGNVGVAGSAIIGSRCQIGGAANILGHLTLADDVHVSVATVVTRSIHQPGLYSGSFPFDDNSSWEKNAATLRQLHTLRDRVRALEKQTKS